MPGPNLLTANQAGFETDASGVVVNSSSITVSRTTISPRTGAGALLVEMGPFGSGLDVSWTYDSDPVLYPTTVPATAGVCYRASLWVRSDIANNAAVRLAFIDAARTEWISYVDGFRTDGSGGNVTVPGEYVEFALTAVAPAGTAYLLLMYLDAITVDGDLRRIDDVYLGEYIPPNDNWANAEILVGDSGSVVGTTVCATSEPGEPGFT